MANGRALFDTNILVDHLAGIANARDEIASYADPAISVVTWMEVLVGAKGSLEAPTRAFLDRFRIIEIDREIAYQAVLIRRERRVKLPDAIIWATARVGSLLLVTRDTKDFPEGDPSIRSPYSLD